MIAAMHRMLCLLVLVVTLSWSQQQKLPRPDFKDYPVQHVYKGTPAAPKITKDWRMFRTRIREGGRSRVEFAGHYTVPRWGCGAGCSDFVIVDSITGKIFNGFVITELPLTWMEKNGERERMEFHANSRLIRFNGCPNEQNCGFYDYVIIEGKGLKLIQKELLPKEFQYPSQPD